MLLFQVYSSAIASFVCPPLLLGMLGNRLHVHHGWNRAWMAALILLGLVIGGYSAVSYLKKTAKITSARSQSERDGPYRMHRSKENDKNA